MLEDPAKFMTDSNFMDPLQPQTLFPHRNRQPQCPLIVFKAISTHPRRTPRKLHRIQDNENIRQVGFVKKSRKRQEVRLVGGYDH